MDPKELKARLDKLLWVVNVLADEHKPFRDGKANAESWMYHLETVREAIKQLAQPEGTP